MGFFKKLTSTVWGKCTLGVVGAALVGGIVFACFMLFKPSDKYCSVIPKDAVLVAKGNLADLIKESEIDLNKTCKQLDIKESDILETGIDITKNAYVFVMKPEKGKADELTMGSVVALKDMAAFEKYIGKEDMKPTDKGDYKEFVSPDNSLGFCFDNEKLLVLKSVLDEDITSDKLAKLMKQEKSESVLKTDLYSELRKNDEPLALAADLSALKLFMSDSEYKQLTKSAQFYKYEDFHVRLGLKLDGNKLILGTDVLPQTDEAKEKMKEARMAFGKIQGDFFSTGDKAILWFGCNVVGEGLAKIVENAINASSEIKMALAFIPVNVMDIIRSFNGDMTFYLNDEIASGSVKGGFYAKLSKTDEIKKVFNLLQLSLGSEGAGMLETKGENQFSINIARLDEETDTVSISDGPSFGDNIFFGMKNNVLYVSNTDDKLPTNQAAGMTAAYEKGIKSMEHYTVIDLKTIVKLANQIAPNMLNGFVNSNIIDKLTFTCDKNSHCEMTLSVDEGKKFMNLFLN